MTPRELIQALQARGFGLQATVRGTLLVSPASQLTAQDRAAIGQHVRELLELVEADHEWLEERAGILEFDGGHSRAEAERIAAELLRAVMARSRGTPA